MKPGTRLKSSVCDTEVVIVRPPREQVTLECGGAPMGGEAGAGLDAAHAEGTLLGKRYVHEPVGLEVLCVKPGKGSLSVAGTALTLKDAKQLPSSD
ncbi:MAG: hypothetical protein GC201_08945 [Alphaproteobacteria bacterium]|nr:hypothetical protein [Alphaproteobacteria bacterium]